MNLFNVYPRLDFSPVRGNGCSLFDEKNNEYLDLYGGHAVISIGHSHPHFLERIKNQLDQMAFYSNSLEIPLQKEFANKLGTISGFDSYELFLCNSGAEAVENALKLASFETGKTKVIAFEKAYHGRTSAAINITDHEKVKAPINTTFPVEFHKLNHIESVENSLKMGDVAAVIIEGIQGWGGIYPATNEYLQQLEVRCKKYQALLILDEVQSGYGRTGDFFAFQPSGIQPDLITIAKGMGNGFPIAGVLINPAIKSSYGLLGSTFGGNHLACAAGLAVLEVIEKEDLLKNAKEMGDYLKEQLTQINGVVEIRGRGLMLGLEFEFPIKPLRTDLYESHRILAGTAINPNVFRILPPLTLTKGEVDLFIKKLKLAVEKFLVSNH